MNRFHIDSFTYGSTHQYSSSLLCRWIRCLFRNYVICLITYSTTHVFGVASRESSYYYSFLIKSQNRFTGRYGVVSGRMEEYYLQSHQMCRLCKYVNLW